jgi:hypothetical protein
MGRSVSWETMQKLFSYEISLRNPWATQEGHTFELREKRFASCIEQHLIQRDLLALLEQYAAYHPVTFASITVSQEELMVKQQLTR